MALETFGFIDSLVDTNPTSSDPKSQGDDHIRGIKATLLDQFPNLNGAMTSSDEELNIMDGATLSTAELNILDGVTASTAEINLLDGVTATTTEINYIDGVTSAIQTQFDLKSPLASPTFTGTPAAPTASAGSTGTQLATLDFVNATGFASSLPGQTGNAGKILNTDGTNASWGTSLNVAVVSPSAGTAFATTTATQTLTGKTLTDLILANAADVTKRANFITSGITAGQNRNVTLSDENMTLFTPGMRLLSTVTAAASATADVELTFDSTYDSYMIVLEGVRPSTNLANLNCRLKVGGSYVTGAADYTYYRHESNTYATANGTSISIATSLSSAADSLLRLNIFLGNPESTTDRKLITWTGGSTSGSIFGVGHSSAIVTALTGVRFLMSGGNIEAGTFRLYGLIRTA